MEAIGSMHFRLHSPGGEPTLMRSDVRMDGSSIFVFISDAPEGWPFTIENDSNYDFAFTQTVCVPKHGSQFSPYIPSGPNSR